MTHHIVHYLRAIAEAFPDSPAVTFRAGGARGRSLDYGALEARSNRAANLLAELGVGRGDHVGCHLHDTPAHVDVLLGAWKLGAVPINVNYRYVPSELAYLFDDAELKLVVTEPSLAEAAREAAESCPGVRQVLVADERYEAELAARGDGAPDVQLGGDDRYILYTGGTTGMPKGVMWRHEDVFFACFGADRGRTESTPRLQSPAHAVELMRARGEAARSEPRTCPLFPLMHGGGQWVLCRMLARGGSVVLLSDVSFDARDALRAFAEENVSVVWGAGDAHARPVIEAIAKHHGGSLELPRLRLWITGAVMVTPAIKEQLGEALPGTLVFDVLGASETGAQGAGVGYSDEGSPRFKTGDGALILDDDLRPIPPGDRRTGKLAKTGHIPLGYYKDEVKTAATFPVIDGVRYSVPGDLARWDDDGFITLFGRGSVSINSGGEKIYPEEVEKALKTHPAVFDAVVVGTPDPRFGKRVTAVIQLRPDAPDPGLDALADHCRTQLAGYKVPRAHVVVDTIVRSPSGKPDYPWATEAAVAALEVRGSG